MKWVLLTLFVGANPFEAWERLPERVSYATTGDAFGAWAQLGEREAAFSQWEELCRHKCGLDCTCGDECECSADCECITKAKTAKPSAKLSPEAQKKLDASRAKPKTDLSELSPHYPVRDSRTWWTHPGQRTKANIINHLLSGEHAGKFRREVLEKMTLAELESLHSDDHERKAKPIASAGKKMIPVYENRKQCVNGVCGVVKVFVGYRWE